IKYYSHFQKNYSKNFLESSRKIGNLLLEEKDDFWRAQGQLALSVLLAQFLSVSKDVRFEAFISFVNGQKDFVTQEDLSETAKAKVGCEVDRFLTQSPQTMRASIEVLQRNLEKAQAYAHQ
uniref:hypothetical protein n=1 Tax=Turicimonas muris TaxID=1796652 RepID=UPI00273789AD